LVEFLKNGRIPDLAEPELKSGTALLMLSENISVSIYFAQSIMNKRRLKYKLKD